MVHDDDEQQHAIVDHQRRVFPDGGNVRLWHCVNSAASHYRRPTPGKYVCRAGPQKRAISVTPYGSTSRYQRARRFERHLELVELLLRLCTMGLYCMAGALVSALAVKKKEVTQYDYV